jgi:hypothetical protein
MAGQEAVVAAMRAEHNRRIDATRALLESFAAEMGNWMQSNAKWTDRTANARNSLNAVVEFGVDAVQLIAQGGGPPDYVKFLELAHGGKYAVVRPCLLRFAPDILKGLKRIWQ